MSTPATARNQGDPLAGIPNKRWCKFYDTLPMTDMTEQQMMDEMTFYPQKKHDLSRADCLQLVPLLAASMKYAKQFPTAADAMRAGFHMIAPYVEGQGAHYVGPSGWSTTFNRRQPNFLLYGGNTSHAPLVGIMWLANTGSHPPPLGMPGLNDHWHRHGIVCIVNGLIVAEGLSSADCSARGGSNINIDNLWMLHAWILPGYTYLPDVFRPHVPFLGNTAPDGSKTDPDL
jgi:hypothetical protein